MIGSHNYHGKVSEWLINTLNNIIQWGINTYHTATDWVSNTVEAIVKWFSELPGRIQTWLTNTINNIITWGSDMVKKGREAAENLCEKVVEVVQELPGKMLELGKQIVEGIWNGITGAGDWIKNKVGEFSKGILDGMKEALGIHSPSRLFRDEVGKYIALGVGEGFTDNISKVYKQMQNRISLETSKLSGSMTANIGLANQAGSLRGNIGNSSNATNSITVQFYPQHMTEAELDRAINYIDKRFGLLY